jgi:hypothetical protein
MAAPMTRERLLRLVVRFVVLSGVTVESSMLILVCSAANAISMVTD